MFTLCLAVEIGMVTVLPWANSFTASSAATKSPVVMLETHIDSAKASNSHSIFHIPPFIRGGDLSSSNVFVKLNFVC